MLSASASELEADLPFWVFVDALDEYVQGLEPRRLDALEESSRAELGHILPSLARAATDTELQDGRYRSHRAMRLLLEALAAPRPLVLLLDDMHWADSGSIDLLGSLLRRPPAAAVLIAVAARPRRMPDRLAGALERAHRLGTLTRLELGALTSAEARELVGSGADVLYNECGGNPFFLEQLARSPARPGATAAAPDGLPGIPRAVAAAITEELTLLPDDARRLLEGAAVAGDPFEPELAAAAAGLPEATALEALDELLALDLARTTDVPRRFRFRHPLVRRAVYEAAPGGWLITAHERSASALAMRGASAAARAHHVVRCARHGDASAVAVLREAAESAVRAAPATAARLFDAALRLLGQGPERAELLGALASAHAAAGQFQQAYTVMLESLEALPPDALAQRVRLTAACAGLANMLGRHEEAHARLRRCLEGLTEVRSPAGVELMIELSVDGFYRMEYGAMRDWARRALDATEAVEDRPLRAMATSMLAFATVLDGAGLEAANQRAEAASLLDRLGDDELALCIDRAANVLAATCLYLGRYDEAGRHAERALTVARATGQGQVLPILFWSAVVDTERGRLSEAAQLSETAIEIARLSGHLEGQAWNLFARSRAATAEGDVETALATGQEAVDALRGVDKGLPAMWAGVVLADALCGAGDPRALDVLVTAAGGGDLPLVPPGWSATAFELMTRCLLARGERDQAARAAARAQAAAEALGMPIAAAMAARATAAVALDAGDATTAAEDALRSAALAEEVGAPLDAARARALAGRAFAQAGDAERATAELERAAAAFEACGALPRRDESERELGRLGRRRHRRTARGKADGEGVETLTERELQVARLIVDRRTNPQIAAELFLSTKTVETHVRNLFHKLGVSSRVDIARTIERADRDLTPR